MATIKSVGFQNPKPMRVDGTAVHIYDKAVLPAVADVAEFVIPAGFELMRLDVRGPGAMTFAAGIRPVRTDSTIAVNPTFFANAGQAFTAGQKTVTVPALRWDEDVVLTLTTAAAAGTVDVVMDGNAVGAR